jgi:myo-inositol-1-phosphate synthase
VDRKIKLAVIGVGNCASSLIQGIEYYKDAGDDESIPGLMHANFGGYHIRDIEIVAAFDVNADKVGKDVAEAIYAAPNNTTVFARVPTTGVLVAKGPRLDGVNKYTAELVPVDDAQVPVDVVAAFKAAGAEIVVNYVGPEVRGCRTPRHRR